MSAAWNVLTLQSDITGVTVSKQPDFPERLLPDE